MNHDEEARTFGMPAGRKGGPVCCIFLFYGFSDFWLKGGRSAGKSFLMFKIGKDFAQFGGKRWKQDMTGYRFIIARTVCR